MRIIHCADIHADSSMGTHFTKEQGAERRKEIIDTFANMVRFARENDVRVIIIAGDLFDTKETLHKTIKKRIAYIIAQNPQIDFLYLRGNHDEDVEFATDENLPNLKRFSKSCWTAYGYGNVQVYGHEFSDSIPLAAYKELTVDSKNVNIVALHGQVAEYRAKDGAPVISLPKLANQNIDYIALGHIHDYKAEKLDYRCTWCYSGCLEGRGFDECGEKGFVLLEVAEDADGNPDWGAQGSARTRGNTAAKITSRFISLAQRKIHQVFVELGGTMTYADILQKITQSLAGIPAKDIVQVVLTGEVSEETDIESEAYQNALSHDFYYICVKNHTETKIDYAKYENDVSLKGEFIRLVKAQEDISDDDKAKIIMTGIKALAGRLG